MSEYRKDSQGPLAETEPTESHCRSSRNAFLGVPVSEEDFVPNLTARSVDGKAGSVVRPLEPFPIVGNFSGTIPVSKEPTQSLRYHAGRTVGRQTPCADHEALCLNLMGSQQQQITFHSMETSKRVQTRLAVEYRQSNFFEFRQAVQANQYRKGPKLCHSW